MIKVYTQEDVEKISSQYKYVIDDHRIDDQIYYIMGNVLSTGRPAPPCSNPDSPSFGDSGDPADIDMEIYMYWGKAKSYSIQEFNDKHLYLDMTLIAENENTIVYQYAFELLLDKALRDL